MMKKFNITENYFWHEMDIKITSDMLSICNMTKEEHEKIWEKKRNLGDIF